MPDHETRNTFYWIICNVKTTRNEIKPVYVISHTHARARTHTHTHTHTHTPLLENENFETRQTDYIGYVIAKLSKYVKISM